jgi:hypothetical protein
MLEFARQSTAVLKRVYDEAEEQHHIRAYIVEKDFWVCWLLRLIFADPELSEHLVFKGGTSLSKVFGIIQRFSEDIDLSVDPAWLGFDGHARPDAAPSRSQFDKRVKALENACIAAVRDRFQPAMTRHIAANLPGLPATALTFEVDEATHSPVLLFAYPRAGQTGSLHPQVKLEFGSLYDQRPTGTHPITPLTAQVFPQLFREPSCPVVALEAERTFWEKATLLHAEYHRPPDKPLPVGMSRHHSDLAELGRHEAGQRAVGDLALLARVRTHKQMYFRSAWAHYETAAPGSFRLVPPPERRAAIERDYRGMADMFIVEPRPFDLVLSDLGKLEQQINAP